MRCRVGPRLVDIQDAVAVGIARHIGRSRGRIRIRHHQIVDLDVAGIVHRDGIGNHIAHLVVGQRIRRFLHHDQSGLFNLIRSRGRQWIHRRLAGRHGWGDRDRVGLQQAHRGSLGGKVCRNGPGLARGHGANFRPVDRSVVDVVVGGRRRRHIGQVGGFIGIHNRHVDQGHVACVDHRDLEHHRIAHLGHPDGVGASLLQGVSRPADHFDHRLGRLTLLPKAAHDLRGRVHGVGRIARQRIADGAEPGGDRQHAARRRPGVGPLQQANRVLVLRRIGR